MKKNVTKYLITIIILACVGVFFYSYIGIDKETGVPKGVLRKIRPLQWEEIYWDESKQLLKLTVKDETSDGKESRSLRIFELTSSGLLMGGQEYRSVDATSFINARLDYSVNELVLIIRDKKYTEDLCHVNLEGMLEEGDSITSIEAGPVYYELGEDVVLNVKLRYRTENHEELQDLYTTLYTTVSDPDESDIEVDNYELGELSYVKRYLPIKQKNPEITIKKDENGQNIIRISDEELETGIDVQMEIPLKFDKDGNIIKNVDIICKPSLPGIEFDNLNVYFDDQTEETKFFWITIYDAIILSETEELSQRIDFEYDLMFKIDRKSLKVFDIDRGSTRTY